MEPLQVECLACLQAFLGHGALKISKEKPSLPYIPSPSLISLPNEVVSCTNVEVGKIGDKIVDPFVPSPSSPYNQNLNVCLINLDLI